MNQFDWIAHTGCDGTPYNSLVSCQAGYETGADVLEVDVRTSRDGIAVLYHDDQPDVSQYTYEEWTAAGYEPVEKLETILTPYRGKPVAFNLDLKTEEAYAAAAAVVDRLDVWSQVYFTGVTDHLANGPRAKHVIWNLPPIPTDLSDDIYEERIRQYCQQAEQAGYAGINAQYGSCRPALVAQAHQLGLRVWLYTLPADEPLLRHYADMGVDALSVTDLTPAMELMKRGSTDGHRS